MAAPRRRNAITWVAPPVPAETRRADGVLRCEACLSGDCDRCTRVGCFHQCPDLASTKHGVSALGTGAEHGAPGPGRRG